MLALSIHYLELKSDCKQLFCDHMAAEFGAQRFYLCFVAFNTHTDTQTHAYTSLRFGVLDPGRQVALFGNTVCKLRGGALIILMLSAERWRFFFFFFLPCSWVGRHIPLALLSGLFPAAGGFCQPLPHCLGFLCSPAPTMAFFLPLYIYVHFLPLCVLFVLFCCLLCFSFLLL